MARPLTPEDAEDALADLEAGQPSGKAAPNQAPVEPVDQAKDTEPGKVLLFPKPEEEPTPEPPGDQPRGEPPITFPGSAAELWRAWRYFASNNPDKPDKVPTENGRHRMASWQDGPYWTLDRARGVANAKGVGLILMRLCPKTKVSYSGVDLDHCTDDSGAILPEAQQAIDIAKKRNLYVEKSVSGHGVHIIGRGSATPVEVDFARDADGVITKTKSTWFTVSGDVINQGDPEADVQAALVEIRSLYRSGEENNKKTRGRPLDAKVIEAARRMPNARERTKGWKFECPGCRAEGRDKSQDNGFAGFDGTIGCAVDDSHNAAIRKALGLDDDFARDHDGGIFKTPRNAQLALRKLGAEFWLDQFNDQVWSRWNSAEEPLTDEIVTRLRFEASERFGVTFPKDLFFDVVVDRAYVDKRHPVRDYFSRIAWDGTKRIDNWLPTYFGVGGNDYVHAVGRCWLCAAAKRILEPGCKFDEMLVLESEKQGKGKSEGLAALCSDPTWFTDALPIGADSKLVVERTRGVLIAEISEMQGLGEREVEHVKTFLSCKSDGPVRLAYGRVPVRKRREFVCAGTTNLMTDYLRDTTGNRRFWPVGCGDVKVAAIATDRDQLWAEAVAAVKAGESIRLDKKHWAEAEVEQQARQAEDPWYEALAEAFGDGAPDRYMTTHAVWATVGVPLERRRQSDNRRLGQVMRRLGYHRGTAREKDTTFRAWIRGNPTMSGKPR